MLVRLQSRTSVMTDVLQFYLMSRSKFLLCKALKFLLHPAKHFAKNKILYQKSLKRFIFPIVPLCWLILLYLLVP